MNMLKIQWNLLEFNEIYLKFHENTWRVVDTCLKLLKLAINHKISWTDTEDYESDKHIPISTRSEDTRA